MGKSKIYTGTGDTGFTSLVGGKRIAKTDLRIDAYGTVDELNAFIACLLDEVEEAHDRQFLLQVQHDLFNLGAYLATEGGLARFEGGLGAADALEAEMDKIAALVPPSNKFILPGGCRSNSLAHVCRTVCRRAERCLYTLSERDLVDAAALKYINRLSDYFFLLARKQSFISKQAEIFWENTCK
ncbi:cob(I)yrinic acid a,c-diamide adenosyltransferase [Candidatus Symbiothrix dinenymphae]|uniref:cob(I)yrinic acid a,c-diamide adenosyltransferase n=1 Tax=Candidatus Symbiothrix dinenymphae TaxID=467085 RepID=UPI0006C4545D|nr:cob(I)yrinic acid a,c-diamide adenosyltransferase [Candidatus Symbiothrix dinenymphae]GAP72208.1 ATP:corrinoid adenosyltransferase [Candidatus Symbiothrix dinenymphae]